MSRKRFNKLEFYTPVEDDERDLVRRLEEVQSLLRHAENYRSLYQGESTTIRAKLREMRDSQNMELTDHALLRYLERVKGVDIVATREEVLSQLPNKVEETGIHYIRLTDDLYFVMRHNLVLTIRPPETLPNHNAPTGAKSDVVQKGEQ